jgi:hypothetical protein
MRFDFGLHQSAHVETADLFQCATAAFFKQIAAARKYIRRKRHG